MRSDPIVQVNCDRCDVYVEEVGLTATARGYDERNITGDLRKAGWQITNNGDICPDCVEKAREGEGEDAEGREGTEGVV